MGKPKGLVKLNHKTLLEYQIDRLINYFDHIHIVTGAHHEEYLATLPGYHYIKNSNWQQGPFSSLLIGLKSISITQGCWVIPIDCPSPDKRVWELLLAQHGKVIKPTFKNRGGHPIFLSYSFIKILLKIDPTSDEARLDKQIQKLKSSDVIRLAVDDELVCMNLNTPEKLDQYKTRFLHYKEAE